MRSIRHEECCNDEERRIIEGIANFTSHIEWTSELKEEGGITWLELYIWYRMHSAKIEEDPLAITKPLMSDIAAFKNHVRKVATYCTKEEEEWVMSTCYGRANRLEGGAHRK